MVMRWPFVSRQAYEDARADVARYRELWLAAVVVPAPAKPAIKTRTADPVQQAIREVAGNDGQLRSVLGAYARKAKRAGAKVDEIVAALSEWPDATELE